jgi:hypothetical protein
VREALSAGLDRVDALTPGQGFAEVTAGARGLGREVVGFARGEVGWKPAVNSALFAFGEASFGTQLQPAWMAGIGARVTW